MLSWIIAFLAPILYGCIGVVIARLSCQAHDRQADFVRFLLFPVGTLFSARSWAYDGLLYLVIMTLVWPLKLAWNAVFVPLLVLPMLVKLARARNFAVPKNGAHPA